MAQAPTSTAGAAAAAVEVSPFGGGAGATQTSTAASPSQVQAAAQPSASVVQGVEAQTRATTDVGDLLAKSESATGVVVQHRSPIITDPRVRGYHVNQLLTTSDGAFWLPARPDLDTIVSKLDSNRVQDTVLIKGPYSVRYGPGFAFLDVETYATPRYKDGFELHGTTYATFKTNGSQWNAREAVFGGGDNWGFRLGATLLYGRNYLTGSDFKEPSSYNSENFDFALGYDLRCDTHLEFKALRLDQRDVLVPSALTDINVLRTDGYTLRLTVEDQDWFDRLTSEGWYNYTRLAGDNLRASKRAQVPNLNDVQDNNFRPGEFVTPDGLSPRQRVLQTNSLTTFTKVDTMSSGYRQAVTWGKDKELQLTIGGDFHYISQRDDEQDPVTMSNFVARPPAEFTFIDTNIADFLPRSKMADGGFFVDASVPLGDRVTFKAGARTDWVTDRVENSARTFFLTRFSTSVTPDQFRNRDYDLWAAYGTLDWKVTDHITAVGGFGTSKRPPSLWELYAVEPIVGIVQSGLSSLTGNTFLKPEQLYQMDLGLKADYGWFRAGINGFYAWVFDYITLSLDPVPPFGGSPVFTAPVPNPATGALQGPPVVSPQSFRFYHFVNTNRASLAGGECYAEVDVTDYLTPFGVLSYVEGMDNTRDHRGAMVPNFNGTVVPGVGALGSNKEPLPGIPPLEATVGVRLHEARRNPRYGMEFTARIVSAQNRFAESLFEQYTGGFTIYDVRSYWQVNKNLLLTAGVENLGDKNYQEHLDYKNGLGTFQPGVNFYCGFKLDY